VAAQRAQHPEVPAVGARCTPSRMIFASGTPRRRAAYTRGLAPLLAEYTPSRAAPAWRTAAASVGQQARNLRKSAYWSAFEYASRVGLRCRLRTPPPPWRVAGYRLVRSGSRRRLNTETVLLCNCEEPDGLPTR
jgi:hypothetical protein